MKHGVVTKWRATRQRCVDACCHGHRFHIHVLVSFIWIHTTYIVLLPMDLLLPGANWYTCCYVYWYCWKYTV